jgi:hypothetical protein
MGETVVGRGKVQGPVALSGSNTNATALSNYINNINSRLTGQNITVTNTSTISSSDAWIQSLSKSQQGELAAVFKKMGHNVKDVKSLGTLLTNYPEVTTAPDYQSGLKTLVSMLIPGTDTTGSTGPSVTQSITKYDDNYLKGVGNSIAQDFLGRNLNTDELNKILPKLQDIVNKGSVTTSKVVGGKNVVTTTPGFTQAEAQNVVQNELRLGASKDLQTKQYLDFADFLSKNMAGM